jgi:hypothetical protein
LPGYQLFHILVSIRVLTYKIPSQAIVHSPLSSSMKISNKVTDTVKYLWKVAFIDSKIKYQTEENLKWRKFKTVIIR